MPRGAERIAVSATMLVIASGSAGNCVFVRIDDTRLLVDAGVPGRAVSRALSGIGESVARLDAVLLTHEHTDHVRGLDWLVDRVPGLTVLASRGTARALARRAGAPAADARLRSGHAAAVGAITVTPFTVRHDAVEPLGFRLDGHGISLGYATDLGDVTPDVRSALEGCRVLVIEANHDTSMLAGGEYPLYLKRRIASPRGHLSNDQAASLLRDVRGPWLERVILAHLSARNNTPECALSAALAALGPRGHTVSLSTAHRDRPGRPVLMGTSSPAVSTEATDAPRQLGLFD